MPIFISSDSSNCYSPLPPITANWLSTPGTSRFRSLRIHRKGFQVQGSSLSKTFKEGSERLWQGRLRRQRLRRTLKRSFLFENNLYPQLSLVLIMALKIRLLSIVTPHYVTTNPLELLI
ncbi:hypothetical protein VNO77_04420 [Canavalia gladiata]|uniref:Uncharacterized protein n=1 Tax=Canavalia gladiata TaxID=3824 RepID=A0AAN9MWH4_CANGL